ncbi:hypothetical protein BD560DRAFT_474150 [Blakeslea trispora]|nr:hypothetical protein BD560DRAFT_474150 [Blakeslea trispora]
MNYIDNQDHYDLYAARLSKPPTVSDSSTLMAKDTKAKRVTKTIKGKEKADEMKRGVIKAAKHSEAQIQPPQGPTSFTSAAPLTDIYEPMMDVTPSLPIAQVPSPATAVSSTVKRRKSTSTVPDPSLTYDIVEDILKSKANIDVGDLLVASPRLKRQFIKACSSSAKLAFVGKTGEPDTTAMYSDFFVKGQKIPVIIDTGAARTCMSKELADKLSLDIDAPSNTVLTMGNGVKQPALGLIFDVPISAGGQVTIPATVEVLPTLPSHLLIGTDFMAKGHARISLESNTIKYGTRTLKLKSLLLMLEKPRKEKLSSLLHRLCR